MKEKIKLLDIFRTIGVAYLIINSIMQDALGIYTEDEGDVWKSILSDATGDGYLYPDDEIQTRTRPIKRSIDIKEDNEDFDYLSNDNDVHDNFSNDSSDMYSNHVSRILCKSSPVQCNYNTSTASERLLCQMLKSSQARERFLCELVKRGEQLKDAKKLQSSNWYLPDGYNSLEIPVVNSTSTKGVANREPLDVQLCLRIRGVLGVDEFNEGITLDIDVFVVWIDSAIQRNAKERGIKNPVFLKPDFMKKIWIPDIYFEELTSISRPAFLGNSLTLYHIPLIGEFIYRSRIITKLACAMDFHYYPADTQVCNITVKSFTYDASKLRMKWFTKTPAGVYLYDTADANFQFQVIQNKVKDLSDAIDKGTVFSTLTFSIKFKRRINYHLVQTYLPSIFFVLVTWLCFLIPSHMFEAQILISMSTLLTLTAMFASVRQSTPIVSYVKAIDWWMISCVFFIFAALATFCLHAWIHNLLSMLDKVQSSETSQLPKNIRMQKIAETEGLREKYEKFGHLMQTQPRIWLPVAFIGFNIFYWSWLARSSAYFWWDIDRTFNDVSRMNEVV